MIKIKNLTKKVTDKVLFDKVTFNINKSTLLIGENGVGKTTLLKMILGIDNKYDGDIELSFDKSDISYAPQSDVLIDQYRVKDMINYFCWLNKIKIADKYLDEKLRQYKLISKKKTMISELSGGEKKKLCMLMCFIKKAEIYILDEPTNNLDVDSQSILKDEVLNKNIFIISHDDKIIDINFDEITVLVNKGIHTFTSTPVFYEYFLNNKISTEISELKKKFCFVNDKFISEKKIEDPNFILIGTNTTINYLIAYAKFLEENKREKN